MKDESAPSEGVQRIGTYLLLEKIGEGGMGVVYKALQEAPIHRHVALKLVRRGMDSERVIARFEAERQALARMQHPHIAQVLDAGQADDGRPYFVMELVDGVPITEHCDQARLGLQERLALFVEVCDAVQHAHRKGIIHRDLKPTNILIGERDGRPVPKIIDFGVAKALSDTQDGPGLTLLGELVGTPEYMCPERFHGDGSDLDIRSDVYSLGVVLYELLTGVLPIPREELGSAGMGAIYRRISTGELPRPSMRLQPVTQATTTICQDRSTNPDSLRRNLAGDLDWITLKALERDRSRRYGSVAELAADLGRHLRDEPVSAGPPSARYRLVKFARRHRMGVAAGSLAVAAMLVGMIGTAVGLVRAQDAERVARAAELTARQEAAASEQVATFLENLFTASEPGEARGETATALEILDRGAERVRAELADQPDLQTRMMDTIARVCLSLGRYDQAKELFEEALRIRQARYGEAHPDVGTSYAHLGEVASSRGGFDEALPLIEKALTIQRQALGNDHLEVAMRLAEIGVLCYAKGEQDRAEAMLLESLTIRRGALGEEHPDVADAMASLGLVLHAKGDPAAGVEHLHRALDVRRRALGNDHPIVAENLNVLGLVHQREGSLDQAAAVFEEALAIRTRQWGEVHPMVVQTLGNIARLKRDQGELETSEALFKEALAINRKLYAPHHPQIAMSLSSLGQVLAAQERYADADAHFAEAIDDLKRQLDDGHPHVAAIRFRLGESLVAQGRYQEARPMLEQVLAVRAKTYGEDSRGARATRSLLEQIN